MAEEDMFKTTVRCPDFISLFEWVVMTFVLKNVGAAYQRDMNVIFDDLLRIILEIYNDDVVIKSNSIYGHLVDLHLARENVRPVFLVVFYRTLHKDRDPRQSVQSIAPTSTGGPEHSRLHCAGDCGGCGFAARAPLRFFEKGTLIVLKKGTLIVLKTGLLFFLPLK
jgi:hypothetical protein